MPDAGDVVDQVLDEQLELDARDVLQEDLVRDQLELDAGDVVDQVLDGQLEPCMPISSRQQGQRRTV